MRLTDAPIERDRRIARCVASGTTAVLSLAALTACGSSGNVSSSSTTAPPIVSYAGIVDRAERDIAVLTALCREHPKALVALPGVVLPSSPHSSTEVRQIEAMTLTGTCTVVSVGREAIGAAAQEGSPAHIGYGMALVPGRGGLALKIFQASSLASSNSTIIEQNKAFGPDRTTTLSPQVASQVEAYTTQQMTDMLVGTS